MLLLIIKKTLTLMALIEPFAVVPLFLATVKDLSYSQKQKFAKSLGVTVAVALLVSGLFGIHLLHLLGVTLDGMRVGGGTITLILAIAMVVGHEKDVKQIPSDESESIAGQGHSIVPLGIPLLVGPATMAYSMIHSEWNSFGDVSVIVLPGILCGIMTWLVFSTSQRVQPYLTASALAIIEKLAGFLLAGIAIDLIAGGLSGLFPFLKVAH